MNLQYAGSGAIVLGLALLVTSFFWTSIVPASMVWSEEQALAYQEASARLHADSFDTKLAPEDLAESQASFDSIKGKLDRARSVKNSTPFYLRMTGIAACVLGASLLIAKRVNDA